MMIMIIIIALLLIIVIVIMTIAGHDWNYDRGILGDTRLSALIAL